MDLNSLYPSVIRALNMAPETIVGQIPTLVQQELKKTWVLRKSLAGSWEGRLAQKNMKQ